MSQLPKPAFRGHLNKYIMKSFIGAMITGTSAAAAYYFFVMAPKKAAFAEFARTYDPEEHEKFLIKHGYYNFLKHKN